MRWYSKIRTASADLSPIAGFPYVMIGGGAMSAHGLRESGGDTDILMMSDVAEDAADALRAAGWTVSPTSGGLHAQRAGQEVDIFTERGIALSDLGSEGISDAIGSSSGHVMSKPWMLVAKILASRDKDMPDMSLLMSGMSPKEVSRAKSIAKRYAPWIYDIIKSESDLAAAGVSWGPVATDQATPAY